MAKTILLVEDDLDTQRGLALRLKANSYRVLVAADAMTAVRLARQSSPDLILLDLGMPGGDGHLVMERLQRFPDLALIPILVITARTGDGERQKALQAGAAAYFMKPVDNELLLSTIGNLCGEQVS